jgi:hypothetical protein
MLIVNFFLRTNFAYKNQETKPSMSEVLHFHWLFAAKKQA